MTDPVATLYRHQLREVARSTREESMLRKISLMFRTIGAILVASAIANASQLVEAKLETKFVPGPVEFNVLLPDGYETAKDPLPLLIFLHGGGGDRSFLTRMRAPIDDMWKTGSLPKMVVVTPSASRSFYMDYKDGSQKCESFIMGPFLEHLKHTYKVTRERKGTLL